MPNHSGTSQSDALATLARYRTIGSRKSAEVVALGQRVLSSGAGIGEQEWAVREQLAIAAMDVNLLPLASQQILILTKRFPKSPRVSILEAMRQEAEGSYDEARRMYMKLLEDEKGGAGETFIPAHQRLITLSLYAPSTTKSIPSKPSSSFPPSSSSSPSSSPLPPPTPTLENILKTLPILISYLDSFHTDPDGWSLLSDLYLLLSGWEVGFASNASGNSGETQEVTGWGLDEVWKHGGLLLSSGLAMGNVAANVKVNKGNTTYLPQAMSALSHRVLMEPWSWMTLARYGELALLSGDLPLAYKTLLRGIEISTPPTSSTSSDPIQPVEITSAFSNLELLSIGGWQTRIWWDLKLVCWGLTHRAIGSGPDSLAVSDENVDKTDETIIVEYLEEVTELVKEKLEGLVGKERVEGWEVWAGMR